MSAARSSPSIREFAASEGGASSTVTDKACGPRRPSATLNSNLVPGLTVVIPLGNELAVAGAILAMQGSFMSPEVGDMGGGLIFFVGLFIGGIGTLMGPLTGVALIAIIDFWIRFSGAYRTLILGGILLLCMVVLPRGIVGTFRASRYGSPQELSEDPVIAHEEVHTAISEPVGTVALEAKGVKKHFGGIKAIDGVDIQIKMGRIHGIIGPNGSGKSTLVSMLTRYHSLTESK